MSTPQHDAPPPETMLKMITGYWVSQLVGTIAALDIVELVASGPATAPTVAARAGTEPRATARLLRAGTSVGLFTVDATGRYAPTPLGATLRSSVPGSMRGMAIAQTSPGHWLPWGRFADGIRAGARQTADALGDELWDYYGKNPKEAAAFTSAMGDLSAMVAGEVARLMDCSAVSRVVDVGGANGVLACALLRANSQLSGVVLDLAHVVAGAKDAIAAAGLANRCEVVAGDFFQRVPPADLYVLKQILHDWDDAQSLQILRNCAAGLSPGGRVAVVEMVIPDDGRPSFAALVDLNMLVLLPGQERSGAEYAVLFQGAGLQFDRVIETHSPFQIVVARKA